MTIVDLSDLDTFIRDSLFEVRRGIANSRNATQANPLLGVMVDLPEKIDFEVMVTTDHQGLTRDIVSSDSDNSSELTIESQSSTRASQGGDGSGSITNSLTATANKEASSEAGSESANESESSSESTSDGDKKNGNENGSEASSESESATESEVQSRREAKQASSKQLEKHVEANDRASKTFDEEEGAWGPAGQISTPQLQEVCKCAE
jgi:hypothetical protein